MADVIQKLDKRPHCMGMINKGSQTVMKEPQNIIKITRQEVWPVLYTTQVTLLRVKIH